MSVNDESGSANESVASTSAGVTSAAAAGTATATSALESLTIRDDLFKSVKCFVTGTLDPKVSKFFFQIYLIYFMLVLFMHVNT